MGQERAGHRKEQFSGEMAYTFFEPKPMPPQPQIEITYERMSLLAKAHQAIGRLDGLSTHISDVDLFVATYTRKEALLSSQIEGTQATLDDVLDPEIDRNMNLDVADVVNYIKAMSFAEARMQELPICGRLFKEIHEVLMQGVRGQEKNPGEFRRSQNWIGPQGGSLKNAVFVPPAPDEMIAAMSDLDKFINSEDPFDPLLKIALIHYQFETIHPFLDGNGRIGRMIITMWLMNMGMLSYPVLYISYFFKRRRSEYYQKLMDVRNQGVFENWVDFFLQGVIDASNDSIETILLMKKLQEKDLQRINDIPGKKDNLIRIFNLLMTHPITEIKIMSELTGMDYLKTSREIEKLVEIGLLKQVSKGTRNRRFAYLEYLNILRKDTELL